MPRTNFRNRKRPAAGSLLLPDARAFGVARRRSRWAGLHVLLGTLVLIAWMLLLGKDLPELFNDVERKIARVWTRLDLSLADDWPWDSLLFSSIIGALAVLVALRGPFSDPLGAWWSIGSLLAVCVLAAALHWNSFKRGYLYAAGVLFNLSVSIWLIKYQSHEVRNLSAFVEANVIALCLAGCSGCGSNCERATQAEPGQCGGFLSQCRGDRSLLL